MQLMTRASAKERFFSLMVAWRDAPGDADVDVRQGCSADGTPSVLISIGGTDHALLKPEADVVLDILHDTLAKFPGVAEAEGIDTLIAAIEAGFAPLPDTRGRQE